MTRLPPRRPSPLRARRLLRGERLYDTARALGVHEMLISLVERGERPLTPYLAELFAVHYATPAARLRDEMARWCARGNGPAADVDGMMPPSAAS